ncbi:hypothetical protein H2200_003392 [Cladophialophora chaetospira]|uniref:Nudix hydrolase domain-containing protein n=1 Tax=Cladophialophora chaetospira TaxID=386627 RepID=A0AA38XH99_9EURO|nr:hypothetical protein H2200_003392 [Cladophialophora chaetospira]
MATPAAPVNQNPEKRTVVSVLIFSSRPYASKPYRVLLFRRSEKVRTYQKKLAPIAGSVEAEDRNPLAAAWRELREETGFGSQHIELWRRGSGFEFTDESAVRGHHGEQQRGRTWKVWPFAFRLKDVVSERGDDTAKLGLNLDWEHTGCEWRDVDEIKHGKILHDCVPKLEVTLSQLWIDPGSVLYRELEVLELDHEHGARELATMAVMSLLKILENLEQHAEDTAALWKDFRQQAFHLAFNSRPSMGAAISSAIVRALKEIQPMIIAADPEAVDEAKQRLQAYVARRGEISKQVSAQFSDFLQKSFGSKAPDQELGQRTIKILTLSASSTIRAALLSALDTDKTLSVELRILESRPLNEGAKFAEALTDEAMRRCKSGDTSHHIHDRLRIVLASDATVGILSRGVDLVLIGADRISEAGDVSNKTGSLAAALVSKSITNGSVSVVCISESEKIAVPGSLEEHTEEDNDENELTNSWQVQRPAVWNEMVTVRNIYFEWCPAALIDHYVCEDGTLSTSEIRRRSKGISDLLEEAFPFEQI